MTTYLFDRFMEDEEEVVVGTPDDNPVPIAAPTAVLDDDEDDEEDGASNVIAAPALVEIEGVVEIRAVVVECRGLAVDSSCTTTFASTSLTPLSPLLACPVPPCPPLLLTFDVAAGWALLLKNRSVTSFWSEGSE